MDESISLLWPPGARPGQRERGPLDAETMADLDLDPVVQALSGGEGRREGFVRAVLSRLSTDPAVIAYRQDALTDLLEDEALHRRLQDALPALTALLQAGGPRPGDWVVQQVMQRLNELLLYSEVAIQLRAILAAAPVRAAAFRALLTYLEGVLVSEPFVALQRALPALRAVVTSASSVTIGVNLGPDLLPESAAILNLGAEKVPGRATLLGRILGGEGASHAVTPLRAVQAAPLGRDTPLARDLRALLERVIEPVRSSLDRYLALHTGPLVAIEPELAFLLQGAALVERLRQAGLPVCRAQSLRAEERACALRDSYNIALALRMQHGAVGGPDAPAIVTNPVAFSAAEARIWILTGPNRGGKTIYTRGVGLAQVLFQAGLYVPAREARMSPVDAIYTHFPTPERAQPGMGRLDEEAARLAEIFRRASPRSLILLNEVLAGTSATEGLGLALDVVRGLRLLGARAIYVTHLHELAERIDGINARTAGDARVGSLVAEVALEQDGARERRTFRVRPGRPPGASYASAIAEQHGISFPQLSALLRRRGIAEGGDVGPPGA